MQKIVDFGISESSNAERLNARHDKIDLINGTGEYLGIIQLGNKKVMITRTLTSGKNMYNGKIMANEVEYDTYQDGSIVVYYNLGKSDEIIHLQQRLNHPLITEALSENNNIKDALVKAGVNVSMYTSYSEEKIVSEFKPSTRSVYPDDYDFEEAEMKGSTYLKNKDIKKIPVELIIVTGIQPELFEQLKQAKEFTHMSTYQIAAFLEQLKQDKEKNR